MPRTVFAILALAVLANLSLQLTLPLANAEPAAATAPGPVVVELFTSQGCSSCPPADKLLTEIAALGDKSQLPIYCLSFHVDYWNSLGWKDPYSSKSFTQRQRTYATTFGSRGVYTPQMIVNGATEFVGSRGSDAQQAIQTALATPATSTVKLMATLSSDHSSGEIEYAVTGNQPESILNIALVQGEATNEVPRGENAGRQLTHVRVVRTLKTVPLDTASGKLSLELPPGLDTKTASVVAYVQNRRSMQISGAKAANFATP